MDEHASGRVVTNVHLLCYLKQSVEHFLLPEPLNENDRNAYLSLSL